MRYMAKIGDLASNLHVASKSKSSSVSKQIMLGCRGPRITVIKRSIVAVIHNIRQIQDAYSIKKHTLVNIMIKHKSKLL